MGQGPNGRKGAAGTGRRDPKEQGEPHPDRVRMVGKEAHIRTGFG